MNLCPPIFKKNLDRQAVVVHTFNPSSWGTEVGRSLVSLRPAWSTEQDLGTARANNGILSQKTKQNKTSKQQQQQQQKTQNNSQMNKKP